MYQPFLAVLQDKMLHDVLSNPFEIWLHEFMKFEQFQSFKPRIVKSFILPLNAVISLVIH